MLRDLDNTDWKGKKVLLSGSGNVAQYAALKVIELGGVVLTLSDSTGSLVATSETGFTPEEIYAIADIKLQRKSLTAFEAGSKFKWHEGKRPWTLVSKAVSSCVLREESSADEKTGCRFAKCHSERDLGRGGQGFDHGRCPIRCRGIQHGLHPGGHRHLRGIPIERQGRQLEGCLLLRSR